MTQVAQTLIIEMDARTVSLEAQLAKMEQRLKQFEGKAVQSGQVTDRAVGSIGNRYATAARQIAFAGEQAARTGKLAGEAGRQMLAQGANMALMFGPAGAIGGAVAITTMAVVEMFIRARREMAETTRAFRRDLAEIARAGDVAKASQLAQYLYSGDPFAAMEGQREGESRGAFLGRQLGVSGVERRLADMAAERAAILARFPASDAVSQSGRQLALNALHDEEKALREILPLLRERHRLLVGDDGRGGVLGAVTARAAAATQTGISQDAHKKGAKTAAELEEERQRLILAAREAVANTTTTIRDNLILEIERLEREAYEKFTKVGLAIPQALQDATAAKKDELRRAGFIEPIMEQLDAAETTIDQFADKITGHSAIVAVGLHRQLEAIAQSVELQLQGIDKNTVAYREQEKVLKRIRELQGKIQEGLSKGASDTGGASKSDPMKDAVETGRQLELAARGALQLAEAFGLIDQRSANVLQNIVQIAGSLPAMAQKLTATTALPVIGGIAGLVASLVGDDPADEAHRRALEENSRVIRELTKQVGLLGSADITGDEFGAARSALDAYLQRYLSSSGTELLHLGGNVGAGVTADELDALRKAAEELGIEWDGTVHSIIALQAAIDAASEKLIEFSDDFTGVMGWLDFERRIFGDDGPLANLQKLLEQLGGTTTSRSIPGPRGRGAEVPTSGAFSPAIAKILAAGDPTTAEGRAAMRAIIEEYARLMAAGGGTLDESILGGLAPEEFQQALLEIIGYLDALDQEATGTGTGGHNVTRQITEVTGDRIAGLLTSANAFHQRIALAVEALAAGIIGPIEAPVLAGAAAGGTHFSFGDIVVQLTPPPGMTTGQAQQLGESFAGSIVATMWALLLEELGNPSSASVDAIDSSLQERIRRNRRGRGDNGMS